MRFTVNICTYSNPQMLIHSVSSLDPGPHEMMIYLHLHSRKNSMLDAVAFLMNRRNDIRLFDWGWNRGVGQGTNDTMIETFTGGYDLMIDSQDDLTWGEGDLVRLVEYAMAHPHYYAVQTMGINADQGRMGLQFRAAAFNRVAYEKIGVFDERFERAYWEDIDYIRRATLLGLEMGTLEESNIWHYGSATLALDPELAESNHAIFEQNRAYYEQKWGGLPPNEQFQTPYNIPWRSVYIGVGDRLPQYVTKAS